uniref:Cadherin domain-containing protein n=1 Tax=Hucho hucho TaxID=62062 RepID=A0A4W5JNT9_9TELE
CCALYVLPCLSTGTAVAQDQAQYPDGTRRGISYSLFSGNRLQAFSIGTSTGEIWVQRSLDLDFEDTPRLRLVVKAETASSSSYMAVNLILQDINDNLPRFQLQNYVAYMREAQGYDMPIIQVWRTLAGRHTHTHTHTHIHTHTHTHTLSQEHTHTH